MAIVANIKVANILILEDNLELSLEWQQLLVKFGHCVECQGNAEITLTQLYDSKIDLLIVDMFFRKDDKLKLQGLECLNILDQMPDDKRPKVLAVSGQNIKGSILDVASKVYSVDATLQKPISARELLDNVTQLLNSKV